MPEPVVDVEGGADAVEVAVVEDEEELVVVLEAGGVLAVVLKNEDI